MKNKKKCWYPPIRLHSITTHKTIIQTSKLLWKLKICMRLILFEFSPTSKWKFNLKNSSYPKITPRSQLKATVK
jgi:hypothetical protein